MKVFILLAFYMLMSQGSGASLNGLNQMDKKHEAEEELEDQLHLEKHNVKSNSKVERETNNEMAMTEAVLAVTESSSSIEVTAADTKQQQQPEQKQKQQQSQHQPQQQQQQQLQQQEEEEIKNLLEKHGIKGFVDMVASVFQNYPEVLKEFLTRKSNILLGRSPSHMSFQHRIRSQEPRNGEPILQRVVPNQKPNLGRYGPPKRQFNTELGHQNHNYRSSFFHSLDNGVAGHRQLDRFGEMLRQNKRSQDRVLSKKLKDVRKQKDSAKKSSSSSSSSSSSNSSRSSSSNSGNSSNNNGRVQLLGTGSKVHHNIVTEKGIEPTPNHFNNFEVSSTVSSSEDGIPITGVYHDSAIGKNEGVTGTDAKIQYETDLQRTSFARKEFFDGFPILPARNENPEYVGPHAKVPQTLAEKHVSLRKEKLQGNNNGTGIIEKQSESKRSSLLKNANIYNKPAETIPTAQSSEMDRQDRDWDGVGHAKNVVTSASKTITDKSSAEILSSAGDPNDKENIRKGSNGKKLTQALPVAKYSHRRLIPRRTNRTKAILSGKVRNLLQSTEKNERENEKKSELKEQPRIKEQELLNQHQSKAEISVSQTTVTETETQTVSNNQDSNSDEIALMSLASHLNKTSK